jgi:hypothetical protein
METNNNFVRERLSIFERRAGSLFRKAVACCTGYEEYDDLDEKARPVLQIVSSSFIASTSSERELTAVFRDRATRQTSAMKRSTSQDWKLMATEREWKRVSVALPLSRLHGLTRVLQ